MYRTANISVGFLMLVGILCLVYMSVSFGGATLGSDYYTVEAVFPDVTGLKPRTAVELLGVRVGTVKSISLNNFEPVVVLLLQNSVSLPEDSVAAIKTKGLLGEKYVALTPGGLPRDIPKDGSGKIIETRPPFQLEEAIGKLMFGGAGKDKPDDDF